jgi:hypothetical protein
VMDLTLQIDVVLILLMDSLSKKCLSCESRDREFGARGDRGVKCM